MPGRALGGRGASAVLGGVVGGVVGIGAGGALELARILRLQQAAGILGLLPLLAPAARPAALQSREERVGALRHRRGMMPMMAMMLSDAARTGAVRTAAAAAAAADAAAAAAAPRRRAAVVVVRDLAVAELRGALRELAAPVQVQPGSFLGASVTCKPREDLAVTPSSDRRRRRPTERYRAPWRTKLRYAENFRGKRC